MKKKVFIGIGVFVLCAAAAFAVYKLLFADDADDFYFDDDDFDDYDYVDPELDS